MEGRLRPAPIRRENSSPVATEARSYALALKALQDRVATLEADNELLRTKLLDAKNLSNRQIDRLKTQLESEERAKSAEKDAILRREIAISAKIKEEAASWQHKAEKLAEELASCEARRLAETQELQFQLEIAESELVKTQGKVDSLERELREPFLPPISPIRTESEDGKKAEEDLKKEKNDLKRALEESETARFLLLQHQIKSRVREIRVFLSPKQYLTIFCA